MPPCLYMEAINHYLGFEQLINKFFDTSQPMQGIEIGCDRGQFDAHLLANFGNLRMLTIDPWPIWNEVIENNKNCLNRLWILAMPSDMAAKLLDDLYDFVFIDGDHSYEQCKKDVLNYIKFVRPGGIIAGHNFHKDPRSAHPGVHQAIEEIFKNKYQLWPDFIWYVQI